MSAHWNRCDYCARFISFADFDSGAAKRVGSLVCLETPSGPDVDEMYDTYHVACKTGSEAR